MTWLFPAAEPFRLILADPPWSFQNYGQRGHGAARSVYPLLSDQDLAALPVERIAAKDSACVLWCSSPALAEGRGSRLLEAWGFRPVTPIFVWVKQYPSGAPYCGLGHYTRSGTETALLGLRGSCPRAKDASAVLQVHTAKLESLSVGEEGDEEKHSSKPVEFHARLERLWPELAPRVELFARRRRDGWAAWGSEAPGCDLVFGAEVGSVWKAAGARADEAEDETEQRALFAAGGSL
jgi:N6-adenosine-specific RNA methylase IME4